MKAVYSCYYNVFIKAEESELSRFLHNEWIYRPTAVKVWNTDAKDWDWVPLGKAVYSNYYGIHIIKEQAVYSDYHCSYIFKEEAVYSKYLNSYVERRDQDIVRVNDDYLPVVKFDEFVYSRIHKKYIREENAVYSWYYETYIYSNETVYSNYIDSEIRQSEAIRVWNVDISDFDWVPADMAVFCPSRGYYIIENQSKYSDFYEAYIPVDKHFTYSYEVDSYVDDRDPRFMRLLGFVKDFRAFYPFFMYAPQSYIKKLKNGERDKDVLVIHKDVDRIYIKAIITFANEEMHHQFLQAENQNAWLQDKINIDGEYFSNTHIDVNKEYLKKKNDESLIREIDRADLYIVE